LEELTMRGKHMKKLIAGVMGAAMALSAAASAANAAVPANVQIAGSKTADEKEGKVVYEC
jgi:endo-1,4-beta-xylanase